MNIVLKSIFGLSEESVIFVREAGRTFHARISLLFYLYILLLLIGWFFNSVGAKGINFFLFFGYLLALLTGVPKIEKNEIEGEERRIISFGGVFSFDLLVYLLGGGSLFEKLRGDSLAKGVEDFFKGYARLIGDIALNGSLPFFLLGTIPFGEKPSAFFLIMAGIILTRLIYYSWGLGGNFGKRVTYFYVTLVIIVSFISLIPSSTWVNWTSYNIKNFFSVSKAIKAKANFLNWQEETEDEKIANKINGYLKRLKKGENLSSSQWRELRNLLKETEKKTSFSKMTGLIPRYKVVFVKNYFVKKGKKYFLGVDPGEWKINSSFPLAVQLTEKGGSYKKIFSGTYMFQINMEKQGINLISSRDQTLGLYKKVRIN